MDIALICGRCGKVQTQESEGANLVVDFKQKIMFFICMNKQCKYENQFNFGDWDEKSKTSPLPPTVFV